MRGTFTQTLRPTGAYDLARTLTSGQAFRWTPRAGGWESVLGHRWVRLSPVAHGIRAETAAPEASWGWLRDYLQSEVDLAAVVRTFPDDAPMRAAVAACRGLRLLRQDPWECLASFILSSTKQIVQIQQIIVALCRRFGDAVAVPPGRDPAYAFPAAERLARAGEAELRACKMGFRAPHLLRVARRVAGGDLDLDGLRLRDAEEVRAALLQLPGVGEKIADCVLLFAYGFRQAFPVDVWVARALRQLYFPERPPGAPRLRAFIATHFGPHAGYAQQYLFCYMRSQAAPAARAAKAARAPASQGLSRDHGDPEP